jgi:hypothetical protein
MTIGLIVPLVVALGDWMLALQTLRRLRALPTHTDPGYDAAAVAKQRQGLQIMLAALIVTPVLIYLAFNFVAPEIGAMELF